jgi:hypothetical protein
MSSRRSPHISRRVVTAAVVAGLLFGIAAPARGNAPWSEHSVVVRSRNGRRVFASSTAKCPAGEHVLSGGFLNGVAGMRRVTSNEWRVDGYNLGGSGNPKSIRLTSYANCGTGPVPEERTKTVEISSFGIATATCPSGKVVIGGGFAASPHAVVAITRLERTASNKLRVSAYLRYGMTKQAKLTAIAYCGAGPAPTPVSKTRTLGADGGIVRAACPAGKSVTFGGVIAAASGSAPPLVFAMQTEGPTRWKVRESTAGTLTSLAYCR